MPIKNKRYNNKHKISNEPFIQNGATLQQKTNVLPLKSIYGRRCLTKCHPKGEAYLHPILLTAIGERTNNSCGIDPVHSRDTQYLKIHDMIWADTCRLEDNKIYQPPNELESMLLSFYFNPNDFLSSIYDLHSFDQVIFWT